MKGPYELCQQSALCWVSVQHPLAAALLFCCKKFCQHLTAVAQGTSCSGCACRLCDLLGSSSSSQLLISVLSLSPRSLFLLCQAGLEALALESGLPALRKHGHPFSHPQRLLSDEQHSLILEVTVVLATAGDTS